ncbi:MAG: hypothetical protein K0S91_3287 [Nitrososphaeraceae archaeon]|jgi:hypothetical protein|nr:hypothetical protein [Nitrososphaeraceae archaeon]
MYWIHARFCPVHLFIFTPNNDHTHNYIFISYLETIKFKIINGHANKNKNSIKLQKEIRLVKEDIIKREILRKY